ncbi:MAG: HypC/HybG/HupF family hydrogenase formation chaperone [Alphaproteobacteria bacterium]|nr:HypC/HybG/HupF family hydrogenase formation chaperone [Alphaproteobacteria bacterium]
MCLGIPGQIVEISDAEKRLAIVDVTGVKREVNVACIQREGEPLDEMIGVWTLVHVGFAMSRIDEEEAAKTLEVLQMLGEAQEELAAMKAGDASVAAE